MKHDQQQRDRQRRNRQHIYDTITNPDETSTRASLLDWFLDTNDPDKIETDFLDRFKNRPAIPWPHHGKDKP